MVTRRLSTFAYKLTSGSDTVILNRFRDKRRSKIVRHTETADMILSQVSTDNLATLVAIQEPVRIDDYSLLVQ